MTVVIVVAIFFFFFDTNQNWSQNKMCEDFFFVKWKQMFKEEQNNCGQIIFVWQ